MFPVILFGKKLTFDQAVIGPYTERKIGNSWFRALGISGERFDAPFAEKIGLIHYSVKENDMK